MNEIELLLLVGYMCLYMFLGINSIMMLLEWKAKPTDSGPRDIVTAIITMHSKQENPSEYLKARVYTFGAFLMIFGAIILSKLEST